MADTTDTVDYKVKLVNRSDDRDLVKFKVSPEISETRSVSYTTLDPIHSPGNFRSFKNTANRTFQITNIRLISRTPTEAQENADTLNRLRSWTMPHFGTKTYEDINRSRLGRSKLGMPPPVLLLSAYANANARKNLYRIPIVIENMNLTYPSDVDYIMAPDGNPFPSILTLDLTTAEVHAPSQFKAFDLLAFKQGNLEGF